MSYSNSWKSGTAVLVALGLVTGTAAPIVMTAPAVAQTAFPDVPSNYWASSFIQELVTRQVIAGFPDGTFRPEEPVTRAQFASMIRKAFSRQAIPIRRSLTMCPLTTGQPPPSKKLTLQAS